MLEIRRCVSSMTMVALAGCLGWQFRDRFGCRRDRAHGGLLRDAGRRCNGAARLQRRDRLDESDHGTGSARRR